MKALLTIFTCVTVAACASTAPQDTRPPDRLAETREDGVFRTWETLDRPDAELFVQRWVPPAPAERVVVFHHGLRDHSERYDGWARRLVGEGVEVVAHDMRGHGRSSGRRVWIDDFQLLVDDLHAIISRIRERSPAAPIVLYGHSVGGLVATLYAQAHGDTLAGVVVSAPALQLDRLPVEATLTRSFATVAPALGLLETPFEGFSRDPSVVQAMRDDPLVDEGAGPAATASALVRGIHRAWRDVDAIAIPLLALHGTADALTHPRGSVSLVDQLGERGSLKLYEGAYHDLQHEPVAAQVFADFLAFFDAVTAGGSAAAP